MKKNNNCLEGIECLHCQSQGPFRAPVIVYGDAVVSDDGIEDLSRSESEFNYDIDWRCLDCGKDFNPHTIEEEE